MQAKKSRKIIVDYNKLQSLFRLNCPDKLIIKALKMEKVDSTGDSLIDDYLESLVDYKEFENWGGTRAGAGRKSKNQLENQDENQLDNQDGFQVVDKDTEQDIFNINNNNNNNIYNNNKYKKNKNFIIIPTEQEVLEHAKSMDMTAGMGGFECCPEQAKLFFAYFDKMNWVDKNGFPVSDWKKSFKLWVRQDDMRKYQRGEKC